VKRAPVTGRIPADDLLLVPARRESACSPVQYAFICSLRAAPKRDVSENHYSRAVFDSASDSHRRPLRR
jgi:hypothetical protein